jgi:hypothetical protein
MIESNLIICNCASYEVYYSRYNIQHNPNGKITQLHKLLT